MSTDHSSGTDFGRADHELKYQSYTSRESSYQVDNLESVYLNAPGETDGPEDRSSWGSCARLE